MSTLLDVTNLSKEQQLQLPIPDTGLVGARCLVISGYGHDWDELHGSNDGDFDDGDLIPYTVRMTVGPDWGEVHDVSPSVSIAGFFQLDPDTTDDMGMRIKNCTWNSVPSELAGCKRIQLQVECEVAGGPGGHMYDLAYQLVALGTICHQ